MEVKDLIFYNKEGFQMNANYSDTIDVWNGKIFFDKNSIDTFKTQGIYMFEKVLGTNNTFQAYLEKFQVFNTNGFKTFPKFDAVALPIQNIEKVNNDPTYKTKWIYAQDIEKTFYPGMWIYFQGLNSYDSTNFDEFSSGEIQARKIIAVETGRVLIMTDTFNNVVLPAFTPGSTKLIIPLNIIEVQQSLSEPVWNETSLNTKLYTNKKLSLIADTENAGIYTLENIVKKRPRYYAVLTPTLFTPIAGDIMTLKLNLRTNNLPVSNGMTAFGVTATDEIQVPYIPPFLKIGDTIQAFAKSTPLLVANTVTMTITGINKITKTITVGSALTSQYVDCLINLATNTLELKQEVVLDNNNTYSLPLTYWVIQNKWNEILKTIPGGGEFRYNAATDELYITSDFSDNYSTLTIDVLHPNNTISTYAPTGLTYDVYPLWVKEPIAVEEDILSDATLYNRNIVFNTLDSFGLQININGNDYNIDYDIDVANTLSDWQSLYSTVLSNYGIITTLSTTTVANDTLNIQGEFANVPIFTQVRVGDFADYYVKYKTYQFNNIKSQLLITINEKNYAVPYSTSDTVTVTNWVNAHKGILGTLGILVSNTGNTLNINLLDAERILQITYNIGYIPKSGDLSVYETLLASTFKGSIITGNEIRCVPGTYNFLDFYSTGQKISLNGASKLQQNKSYNIIGLEDDKISLSYQGAYWQEGLPVFDVNVVSDYFIRFPKYGLSDSTNNATLKWSWKDTQIKDYFFYDFTGNQLKPVYENFPDYNGVKPLCGPNGEIELKLISKPNDRIEYITEPTKQQTVFDVIEYTLPFIDDNSSAGIEPEPLQLFVGYKADYESWSKARMYLEILEDVTYNLTTAINTTDDLWVFKDNYLEIQSPTTPFDFNVLGFKRGQIIQIGFEDINVDNKKIATLNNGGATLKIKHVYMHKIVFYTNVIPETSVKVISKTTAPYYDPDGNPFFENRTLNVSLTVLPKVIAYFDVYGESEEEDERHKINLNNRNLNILKLQDFYIFKEVDIKEQGIDWIFLNRKRKELLEIYPEIFNNLTSYKSVIEAINFFGYNDLSFTEYFQNINPESSKFGQLFNMELLNIFNKSVKGWEFSNLAFENLRNEGFRKTNLFSLNYKITDIDGNFINAYSLDEVRIKLLGLKKWLTENIIPLGTKIIDITGKYQMPQQFVLKHSTYHTQNFRVEEYATPVDFKTTGYLTPIATGSDTYDIAVQFFSAGNIEWFEYRIRTFYLEEWNATLNYFVNNKVYHNGQVWKCILNTNEGNEPGVTTSWSKTTIDSLPSNQILKDYRYDDTGTSFTINKLVDPHFIVEVSWHSGYSCTLLNRKVYSVIPDFFKDIKN